MRSIPSTTLICVLAALIVGCDWFSPEAKKAKHLDQGQTYFDKGQYREALIEFRNVVQLDKTDARARYKLAMTFLQLGGRQNLQNAFNELQQTIKLDASNREAQLKLGELYLLNRETAKARERAETILTSIPQDKEAILLRGKSYLSEQQFDEAIADFKQFLLINPDNIPVYIVLAQAYAMNKDVQAVNATLTKAITINPKSIDARLALGDWHVDQNRLTDAEAEYKHALGIDPTSDYLYVKLARFYQVTNRWTDAEATFRQLTAQKPTDDKPFLYLGDFYKFVGKQEDALTSYRKAVEVNSSSIVARDTLIEYMLDLNKLEDAAQQIKLIVEKDAQDNSGRYFTARLSLARRNAAEAIPQLQSIIKDKPDLIAARHHLGLALLSIGDTAQARQVLTDALREAPSSWDIRTSLAAVHLTEGTYDLAIESAQLALRDNSRNVRAAIILGDAYLRKGETAKAKQVFEAIIKALPQEPSSHYRLGIIARMNRNDAEALAHFEEALSTSPHAIEPLVMIAASKTAQGKSAEARDRVMQQLTLSPNNPFMYNLLGEQWALAKEPAKAEAAFKKAMEINDALPAPYLNLAGLYLRTQKIDQAAQEYETALTKNPKLLSAQMMLGLIAENKKDLPKAMSRYEDVLKINPKFAPAANNLAWLMMEQGKNSDVALSYAHTAREQSPQDPNIADTLGWIYYRKGIYLKSLSLLKEAVDKLPENPTVQYHYGMVQLKNGDTAGAKLSLQHALKMGQPFLGIEDAKATLSDL